MGAGHRGTLFILGTRGIPASHGGFETFAQHLALYMTARGWHVVVYCQDEVEHVSRRYASETWRGVELRRVQVTSRGAKATMEFDWHAVRDAAPRGGICLVLGYNTGIFSAWLRLRGCAVITNMDGLEWKRPKWNAGERAWLWANEWAAAWLSHCLVADHPAIADHLATRRRRDDIVMIPYGAAPVERASEAPVRALGLLPGRYGIVVARIEPDNGTLLMVEAFSRSRRDAQLVVLGRLDASNDYHRRVREAAGPEVIFPGCVYDPGALSSLRFHAKVYLHGHRVGGTNPSLVEALWAGNPVIAHDNPFNRWTAGEAGLYFRDADQCAAHIALLLSDSRLAAQMRAVARAQAARNFRWDVILGAYEREISRLAPAKLPEKTLALVR